MFTFELNFSNSFLFDSVASCGRPSLPANGRIVGNIFSHGKSILFYCSFGYSRVGAGLIKCDDGKWDKPFPVCKGEKCVIFRNYMHS